MGFDIENFGIGVLAGWGSAYALYRTRHLIRNVRQAAGGGARNAQSYAARSVDSRYINDLVSLCDKTHLAGEFVKLSDVLIEPRFVPATRLASVDDEDAVRDVFDIVPRVHDHPYLHAPYNIDTLSIDELATGDRALALLGEPGSGRTTALLTIIMHSLNHVQFKPPVDRVQQRLDAEDAKLSDKDRATRIKERVIMQERARERLASEKGDSFDTDGEASEGIPLFLRLMPVYVHMGDMVLNAPEYGAEVDPAEPLVRAVQERLGRVSGSTIPRKLYNRLNKGGALLLIDGFDDLPESERDTYLAWLAAFRAQYAQNFMIVTGPAAGYGALTRVGLTPVFMRPWSDLDTNRAAERWADVWARLGGKKGKSAKRPDVAVVERAKIGNRALPPVEVALKMWANYADDVEAAGVEGWLHAWLTRHLGEQSAALLPQMAQIAALQLDEGYISRARLEAVSGHTPAPDTSEKPAKGDADTTSAQAKLLGTLHRSGILIGYKGERYQFRHPHIAAYLASLTLKDGGAGALARRANQPAWSQALAYAALHTPIDAAVRARLSAPADVLYSSTLEVARWLGYAPPDVAWRANILKTLGTLMTAPSQFPLVRDRAAAALMSTRDANIVLIFRRAVRTANADVRRLACLGMGATGNVETIRDLNPLMQDSDANVQLAASIALGAIGTEAALESMLIAFTEGTEHVREAVAIALAAVPEEGYPVLHEAIEDEDMMIRRAAVFGLRRIRTTWSMIDIYRAFLEDEQWYVRSAAQQAFQESQFGREHDFTSAFPPAEALTWLRDWAAKRGENLPSGDGANQMLVRALQEGEPDVRARSAATMGQLGLASNTRPLYAALRDRHDDVRAAAYAALAELQTRIGRALPAPA